MSSPNDYLSSSQQCVEAIADDTLQLDKLIYQQMHSDVVLIQQIATYIVQSGGKRLRPKVLLLMAKAFGYLGEKHITLAAIIEFIHIATLLHDDVVDQSEVRRGRPSANSQFSNPAAILVGDFLYSRAFQLMTHVDNAEVYKILSTTTNRISEGEVMQLMHIGDGDLSEARYFDIIERKTACLFESACVLGAIIGNADEQQIEYSKQYGYALGMAFQIVDDIMDYSADSQTMGKSIGDDLKEGKVTLPVIRIIQQATAEDKASIKQMVEEPSEGNLFALTQMIEKYAIIENIQQEVQKYTTQACHACRHMPMNVYTGFLNEIAIQSMSRTH